MYQMFMKIPLFSITLLKVYPHPKYLRLSINKISNELDGIHVQECTLFYYW